MHHDKYVGHFDPRDPGNTAVQIFKPKVTRPLDHGTGLRLLDSSDPEIADYVYYDPDGFVQCSWSRAPGRLWEPIFRFARALAETAGATVMNEPPLWIIEYPDDARRLQESIWAERG